MRRSLRYLLLVSLALAACNDQPLTPKPPALPDRYADLRAYDPGDVVKPNPEPQSWMLGCFTVVAPEELKWGESMPRGLELKGQEKGEFGFKKQYAVRGVEPNAEVNAWSWMPISNERLQVNVGTGFFGWVFDLTRDHGDLVGTGRWWSDAAEFGTHVRVTFRRQPCGAQAAAPLGAAVDANR